jgi:hypothetical protein
MKVVPVCQFCRDTEAELRWTNGFTAMRCRSCYDDCDAGWRALPIVDGPLFISGLCRDDILLNHLGSPK